jgi:hypothetical protein
MSDRAQDSRAYILGATICQTADLSTVRQEIAGLRLRGQRKVHWREESDKRRRQISHVGGRDDAMLWVADALCGVTVKQRTGDITYRETIQARSTVRIIEI